MCPHYRLEFKKTQNLLLFVYLGVWAKIEIVIEKFC